MSQRIGQPGPPGPRGASGATGATGPAGPAPPSGTVLPASPTDGQLFVYTVAAGTAWLLRWRTAISRWEFLGGPPLAAVVETSETTASTTFADLATAGPTVIAPLAGDYNITVEARAGSTAASEQLMGPNVDGVNPTDAASARWGSPTANNQWFGRQRRTVVNLGANATVKAVYRTTAGTATFDRRRIEITPTLILG